MSVLDLILLGYLVNLISLVLGIIILAGMTIIESITNPTRSVMYLPKLESLLNGNYLLRKKIKGINKYGAKSFALFFPYTYIMILLSTVYGSIKSGSAIEYTYNELKSEEDRIKKVLDIQ